MDTGGYRTPHHYMSGYSDCVLESAYIENDPKTWNQYYLMVHDQVRRALTSIRLLDSSPIRCLGPIGCSVHPTSEFTLPTPPSFSLGNPYDEQLNGGNSERVVRRDRL